MNRIRTPQMKPPPATGLTAALLIVSLALAGSTPALAAESPSPSTSPSRDYAVQWALLQGVRADGDGAGHGTEASEASEATDVAESAGEEALEWDFRWDVRKDAKELVELFRLSSLETLQQGRSLLGGDRGSLSVGAGEGEERIEIDLSLSIAPFEHEDETFDAARTTVSIRRGGQELSRPTLVNKLGERAIVTTVEPATQVVIYIVIQVDPVE